MVKGDIEKVVTTNVEVHEVVVEVEVLHVKIEAKEENEEVNFFIYIKISNYVAQCFIDIENYKYLRNVSCALRNISFFKIVKN